MSTPLVEQSPTFQTLRFSVPSRSFVVDYEILKDSPLPLVEDFLLRTVAICDSLEPAVAAQFLGLSEREFSKCLEKLEYERWIEVTAQGRLELTARASESMKNANGVPRFAEIEARQTRFQVDLISFQAEHGAAPRDTWFKHSIDVDRRANAKQRHEDLVRAAFETSFYALKRGAVARAASGAAGDSKVKLHRVQSVTGRDYFNWAFETDVVLLPDRPLRSDFGFSQFTKVSEVEARRELFAAVRSAAGRLTPPVARTVLPGFANLLQGTPAQAAIHHEQLDEEFFVALGLERVGDGTDPLFFFGDFSQSAQVDAWQKLLEGSIRAWRGSEKPVPYPILWLPPESGLWARSDSVKRVLEATRLLLETKKRASVPTLLVPVGGDGNPRTPGAQRHKDVFTVARSVDASRWPANVEIILVPDRLASVLFHMRPNNDCVVPLVAGFMTADPSRIERLEQLMKMDLSAAMSDPSRDWCPPDGVPEEVSKAISSVMWDGK